MTAIFEDFNETRQLHILQCEGIRTHLYLFLREEKEKNEGGCGREGEEGERVWKRREEGS